MPAGTTIKHKRKAGPFVGGELAQAEWGYDITNSRWYYSADGTTVTVAPVALGFTPVNADFSGYTAKTTPVDADTTAINDSAASGAVKRLTWANIKATLKAYFDTLYTESITNLTAQSVLGADFTLNTTSGTYQDTGLSVTLPSAGTYMLFADVRGNIGKSSGTYAYVTAKLYNSTDAADVPQSHRLPAIATGTVVVQATAPIVAVVTVAASKTIKLYAARFFDGAISQSFITSNADGYTALTYLKVS